MTSVTTSPGRAPATLRWAVVLLLAEGAVVALVTAYLIYLDATTTQLRRDNRLGNAIMITGLALGVAVLLALCGWALARRRGWARGPGVFLELMLLPIGYFMIQAGKPWAGVPVLMIGLLGAGLLVASPTREALGVR